VPHSSVSRVGLLDLGFSSGVHVSRVPRSSPVLAGVGLWMRAAGLSFGGPATSSFAAHLLPQHLLDPNANCSCYFVQNVGIAFTRTFQHVERVIGSFDYVQSGARAQLGADWAQ
jgi:hypothetical protein